MKIKSYIVLTFLTVKLTTGNDDQFKATSSKTQQTADLFRLEDGRKGSKVMLTEQSDVLLDPPVLCLCQSDLNFISVLAQLSTNTTVSRGKLLA